MISRSVQIVRMAFFFFDLLNRRPSGHERQRDTRATHKNHCPDRSQAAHAGQTAHTSQFFSTRQLSPAAFSELHTLAAAFIDTKGPIEAR
jgi:hypothetical protein